MSEGINVSGQRILGTGEPMMGSGHQVYDNCFTAADKPQPIANDSPRPAANKEIDFSDLVAKVDAAKATGWKGALVKIMLLCGSDPEKLKASEYWGGAATAILAAQAAKDEALETIRRTFADSLSNVARPQQQNDSSSVAETKVKMKIAEQRAENRDKVMQFLREQMRDSIGFEQEMSPKERERLNQKFELLQACHTEMMQAKQALPNAGANKEEALQRLKSAIDRTTESMKEVLDTLPVGARVRVQLACTLAQLNSPILELGNAK